LGLGPSLSKFSGTGYDAAGNGNVSLQGFDARMLMPWTVFVIDSIQRPVTD